LEEEFAAIGEIIKRFNRPNIVLLTRIKNIFMTQLNKDPVQKWNRMNFNEEILKDLDPGKRSEIETNRDLIKPIEQLLCDVHEKTHNEKRPP
jgi:hypothetical protein